MADFMGGDPALDPGLGADVGGDLAAPEDTLSPDEPIGSKLTLTADDVPELTDLQPGDTITLSVDDITEGGEYSLSVAPAEPLDAEPPLEEPVGGGQGAVLDQLTLG